MKKYLIGFIIAIVSIIPISNVKALVIDGRTYDLPDLPVTYAEKYPYTIAKDNNNEIYLIFFTDSRTINNLDNSTFTNYNSGGVTLGGGFITYSIYTYNKNVRYYKLENNEWVYINYGTYGVINYSFEDIGITQEEFRSNPTIVKPFLQDKILYTNVNYFVCDGKPTLSEDCTLFFSNEDLKPQEYLTVTANFANDLDGIEIYNFRFNAINYNSEYQYLIKTYQEIEWTDITEELNNEANQYDYMLYYNTTLYMQVLDADNNILETKTYTVSDLTDYGLKITHGAASDLSGRYINVITIDTRYIYSSDYKYQYSYDNQVFYDMEITEDNKIYYLLHALDIPVYFRILNAGETIVHEQVYNGDFSNVEKNVLFFESTDVIDNQKQIIIQVDFTEYLKFYDMYNFRIWVNDIEYDEQTFALELILTEKNYINAIAIKIQVDNLIIEDFTHRIGIINGTSGGSDTDFINMYDNVVENELENELKGQDYSTIPGMVESIKNFINATGEFITTFFELIMYFFNELNIWIRTCIIALFIELIIFKTIKAVRK